MSNSLEVLFTPAEFAALDARDLSHTTCVVLDILRATSSMVTALAHGATAIIPVGEIAEALALRQRDPELLLAGERHGLRIRAELTGGVEFDLGNSPREYTRQTVGGRTIVSTTTNGTRALRACATAKMTLIASFLNLGATTNDLLEEEPDHLLLVCSGTHEEAAYEDALAAGALCDQLWDLYAGALVSDSAQIARDLYHQARHDLPGAMQHSRNARRLLANPDLRDDVPWCLQQDTHPLVAGLDKNSWVRTLPHSLT
jgi:2-phosphosulfolactate phosphatase